MPRQSLVHALFGLLLTAAVGCRDIDPPRIFHPGDIEYQRAWTEVFDPYADNVVGQSDDGLRPRGYENPRAEPRRAQNSLSAQARYGSRF